MIQPDIDPAIVAENQANLNANGANFMGIDLFDMNDITTLLIRFFLNLIVCWVIIQFFYYKKNRRKDYYLTFMIFSVTVFLLLFMLQNMSVGVGFALGLFAVFGMIRYRTETVQIREMTYLFAIIGISVMNGLTQVANVPWITVLVANLMFIATVWALESNRFLKHTSTKIILYEKIALIKPECYQQMLDDLKERTGLDIHKVEVGHIDFLRDTAFLKVYYNDNGSEINTIDSITKFP